MGEEVRLSFGITRFSSSPGGGGGRLRQCCVGPRGGGKVVAAGNGMLVSQAGWSGALGSAGHRWHKMLWGPTVREERLLENLLLSN